MHFILSRRKDTLTIDNELIMIISNLISMSMLWKKIEKEKQATEWNALQAHNTVYALQAKCIFT